MFCTCSLIRDSLVWWLVGCAVSVGMGVRAGGARYLMEEEVVFTSASFAADISVMVVR